MRITLINQAFHPDVVSTGQHLADLACRLAERGHEVTVVASSRGYDDPTRKFPRRETWRGVRIIRVRTTGFGKRTKWRRATDFASFFVSCLARLCLLPRQDLFVAMTSPPLVSVAAACLAKVHRAKFCYWIMDLNPDEAIAAGWLKANSPGARILERLSRFSLSQAALVVTLDRFMQDRVLRKGVEPGKIQVIPPWSHDANVQFNLEGRREFRASYAISDKFVVMYAGNHSPCHPLKTVLEAARILADRKDIAFCFVGGGAEFGRVRTFAEENQLKNILCLPYQPIERLSALLSAADLHLVVMGDPFVGIVHPCKAYNILRVGTPLLYLGPQPSHLSEMLDQLQSQIVARSAGHGQAREVAVHILAIKKMAPQIRHGSGMAALKQFSAEELLPKLVDSLENIIVGQAGRRASEPVTSAAQLPYSRRR